MKNKRNWGKEIKDVGTLLIIVGIVFIAVLIIGLSSSNKMSIFYVLANKYFIFFVFSSLISLLVGVIVRSIGKSKESAQNNNTQS